MTSERRPNQHTIERRTSSLRFGNIRRLSLVKSAATLSKAPKDGFELTPSDPFNVRVRVP